MMFGDGINRSILTAVLIDADREVSKRRPVVLGKWSKVRKSIVSKRTWSGDVLVQVGVKEGLQPRA